MRDASQLPKRLNKVPKKQKLNLIIIKPDLQLKHTIIRHLARCPTNIALDKIPTIKKSHLWKYHGH